MNAIHRITLICGLVMALAAPCPAQEDPPFLLEAAARAALPQGFRTCAAPPFAGPDAPPTLGLEEVTASASAQFSQAELRQMRRHLPLWVMVVDLRPQPHGFINGLAVTWEAAHPAGEGDDPLAWLEREEAERMQAAQAAGSALLAAPPPAGAPSPPPLRVPVQSAQSEGELLALSNLGYLRLPLSPRPSDQQVEAFLRFRQGLPPGAWLHFHGGSADEAPALLLLMSDILVNAGRLSLEELAARQAWLAGGTSLPPAAAQGGPVGELPDFLARFHQFAREAQPGSAPSWLAWLREQAPAAGTETGGDPAQRP